MKFLALGLFLNVLAHSIRGADPGDARYDGSAFSCDGSSKSLPFTVVNDDFCDCKDGSDEPGTNACKYKFYCVNKGFIAKQISSYFVNDGICDCCDGSDETRIKCNNTCEAENKAYLEENRVLEERLQKGLKVAEQLAERSRLKLIDMNGKIKTQKAKVKKLIVEEKLLEDQLKDAKKYEKQEQRISNRCPLKLADARSKIAQLERENSKLKSEIENLKEKAEIKRKMSSKATQDLEASESEEEIKPDESINAGSSSEIDENSSDFINDIENDYCNPERGFLNCVYDTLTSVTEWPGFFMIFPPKKPTDPTSDISSKLSSTQAQIRTLEDELSTLEERLQRNAGDYLAVSDQCYDISTTEYKYSICLFSKVSQLDLRHHNTINLGSFESFQNEVMVYGGGTACWNGPIRNSKVHFECGVEFKVLNVLEPSPCEYTFQLSSPLSCKHGSLKKQDHLTFDQPILKNPQRQA